MTPYVERASPKLVAQGIFDAASKGEEEDIFPDPLPGKPPVDGQIICTNGRPAALDVFTEIEEMDNDRS